MTRLSTYHLILVTTILVRQQVFSQSSCNDNRTKALEGAGESNLVGAFVPECDSDGYYKTKQCHASTGQCWCVEKDTGHEIEGTRVDPGQPTIDCNTAQPGSCNVERAKALVEAGESNLVGAFVPECKSDGYYKTKQCHASTGQCWCVKKDTGHEIEGTRVSPGQPTIDCDTAQPGSCNGKRAKALEEAGESNFVGAFVPECDSDGYYQAKQCHSSTGQCWCVEKETGNEIEGTRVKPGQPTIDCDAAQPEQKNSLDENDACYQTNKEMIVEWNKRMREYNEIHMERWEKNMEEYEKISRSNL